MKKTNLRFNNKKCDFCGSCVAVCKPDALVLLENSMEIIQERCNACGRCVTLCPFNALTLEKA